MADTLALQKQVVAPGITAYWHPQRGGVHIVKDNGEELTVKDKAMLSLKVPGMMKDMIDLPPNSPAYRATEAAVAAIQSLTGGESTTKLTAAKAREYLAKAKGNKEKARALAKADGWEF